MHVNDIDIPSYSSISTGTTYHPAKQRFPSSPTSSTRSLAMPTIALSLLWLMLSFHGEYLNQENGNFSTQYAEGANTCRRPRMIPLPTYFNYQDHSQRHLIIGQSTGMYIIPGQAAIG